MFRKIFSIRTFMIIISLAFLAVTIYYAYTLPDQYIEPKVEVNERVSIENLSFSPEKLDVVKGSVIQFTNNDEVRHAIITESTEFINSRLLQPGDVYLITADNPGLFLFQCSLFPAKIFELHVK